jgi:hypothetical protein
MLQNGSLGMYSSKAVSKHWSSVHHEAFNWYSQVPTTYTRPHLSHKVVPLQSDNEEREKTDSKADRSLMASQWAIKPSTPVPSMAEDSDSVNLEALGMSSLEYLFDIPLIIDIVNF